MPTRRTKRGSERTQIGGDYDAIVCGASFAGLTVTRELADVRVAGRRRARILLLDRYDVGERQTSACAAPTDWLVALGLEAATLQTFDTLVLHTPHTTVRYRLPWTFSTFDYHLLCSLMSEQSDAEFETATVIGRAGLDTPPEGAPIAVHTDRGDVSAELIVDALGWQRVLGRNVYQPPDAPLSRGLEVHPSGSGRELEIWIDPSIVPAGYCWSFPAEHEVRVGVGSFDPRFHVREPTVDLAIRVARAPVGYQGNWIPHRLRPATEDGVFFVGDSAGHCLPLTAEGIRTAFYFGIACGRELRRALDGRAARATTLRRYAAFSSRHQWQFDWMLRAQRLVPRLPPRLLARAAEAMSSKQFTHWAFNHYLKIAHPGFAFGTPERAAPAAIERELTAV